MFRFWINTSHQMISFQKVTLASSCSKCRATLANKFLGKQSINTLILAQNGALHISYKLSNFKLWFIKDLFEVYFLIYILFMFFNFLETSCGTQSTFVNPLIRMSMPGRYLFTILYYLLSNDIASYLIGFRSRRFWDGFRLRGSRLPKLKI